MAVMHTWTVVAHVRQRGAIGAFYDKTFSVQPQTWDTEECTKNAWFGKYGDEWELHHFVSLTPND